MAYYEIDLTLTGEQRLVDLDIPSTFPAVIKNVTNLYTSYYFAGDYADNHEVPPFYKAAWLDQFQAVIASDSSGSQQSFYWKAYRPLMKRIFQEVSEKKQNINSDNKTMVTSDGISMQARVGDNYLQVYQNGEWRDLLIKGVNLGMGKPGTFPGEAAITKDEYLRWFEYIGEMNANTIRNYTLQPPGFDQRSEYNSKATNPLSASWCVDQ